MVCVRASMASPVPRGGRGIDPRVGGGEVATEALTRVPPFSFSLSRGVAVSLDGAATLRATLDPGP